MPEPADAFDGLRSGILTMDPKTVGIEPSEAHPNAWGVLTEFHVSGSIVTLVSLADGTSSLYFSNGGGIIGAGEYEEVAEASKSLVALAESYYLQMTRTTEFPLPAPGIVHFYVLTFDEVFAGGAAENDLVSGEDARSPLFTAANEVITQIRLHSAQSQ